MHEWLVHYGGGAERVAAAIRKLVPEAEHFALVHDPKGLRGTPLDNLDVHTTFLQSMPFSRRNYRLFLPLMPAAIESLDLWRFDIVISLSHAVAKGVLTTERQLHLCYLQARNLKYAYEDRKMYEGARLTQVIEDVLLQRLRIWDGIASSRPDVTIANSDYVRRWHLHRHGVGSTTIFPPVDYDQFSRRAADERKDYYVTVGRLEPYKRVDVIIEAFKRTGRNLVIVGAGSQLCNLRRLAAGSPNIRFTGLLPTGEVARYIAQARAFVFAAREDFGIAPVEAQATGTPVIAYGDGGAAETITPWPSPAATGLFFNRQDPDALVDALATFESQASVEMSPAACKARAYEFREQRFIEQFERVLWEAWSAKQASAAESRSVEA